MPQDVAFVHVPAISPLFQLGNQVIQLLQIILVSLEARRCAPAVAIAAGQRGGVSHHVLHGPLPVHRILVFVLLEQGIGVHVVRKLGPVHDLVVQAGDLSAVFALVSRAAAHYALQVGFGFVHRRAGGVLLAVLLQSAQRALADPGDAAARPGEIGLGGLRLACIALLPALPDGIGRLLSLTAIGWLLVLQPGLFQFFLCDRHAFTSSLESIVRAVKRVESEEWRVELYFVPVFHIEHI